MEDVKKMIGRVNSDGNIDVLMASDGEAATRIDVNIYPVGSQMSARYEHPAGIVLTPDDASKINLEIDK